MTAATLDDKKLQELEEKFDPEMRFRPSVPPATQIIKWLLIALSCFHFYTAGFGLLRETTHRGVHLAFVLGLVFLVFAASKKAHDHPAKPGLLAPCTDGMGKEDLQKFLPYLLFLLLLLFFAVFFSFRKRKPTPATFRRRATPRAQEFPQSAGLEDCYRSFAPADAATDPRPLRRYSEDDARKRTGSFHLPPDQTLPTPNFNHPAALAQDALRARPAAGKLLEASARDEQTYTESMSADLFHGEGRPATSFRHPLFEELGTLHPHSPVKSIVI